MVLVAKRNRIGMSAANISSGNSCA